MEGAIGQHYNDFIKVTDAAGLSLRVYKENGRPRVCTRDFRHDRVNVNLENGIIKDVHIG